MSNFISAITRKGSFLLPYAVKKLKKEDYKKLEDHCNQLEEITAIFASVNKISAAYRDKCGYVIKRVFELIQNEDDYAEEGFSDASRLNTPTFEGQFWQLGQHPTDPEIVACVFCSILNYAVNFDRNHLFDYNQSKDDIAKFKRTDISIVNT